MTERGNQMKRTPNELLKLYLDDQLPVKNVEKKKGEKK